MPKILTVCICGAFAMSTARREQTFKSNGCSLKSEEFDAIMNLRTKRKTTLTTKCLSEWIEEPGRGRKKKDERYYYLHCNRNDCEELLGVCELRTAIYLLPEREVVVLALVIVHGRPFLPVQQIKRHLFVCVFSAKPNKAKQSEKRRRAGRVGGSEGSEESQKSNWASSCSLCFESDTFDTCFDAALTALCMIFT